MIQTQTIHNLMEKIEELDTLCNERLDARRHFEAQQVEKDLAIDQLSSRILQLYTTYNANHPSENPKTTTTHQLPDTFLIANLLVEIDKEQGSVHVIRYPSLTLPMESAVHESYEQ